MVSLPTSDDKEVDGEELPSLHNDTHLALPSESEYCPTSQSEQFQDSGVSLILPIEHLWHDCRPVSLLKLTRTRQARLVLCYSGKTFRAECAVRRAHATSAILPLVTFVAGTTISNTCFPAGHSWQLALARPERYPNGQSKHSRAPDAFAYVHRTICAGSLPQRLLPCQEGNSSSEHCLRSQKVPAAQSMQPSWQLDCCSFCQRAFMARLQACLVPKFTWQTRQAQGLSFVILVKSFRAECSASSSCY